MLVAKGMPDILLQFPDNTPDDVRTALIGGIDHSGPKVLIESQPPRVWASMKLAILGLIVAYVSKPYFEGFLKEAGKDHYVILKAWLMNLAKRSKEIPTRTIAAEASTQKLVEGDPTSTALSIMFSTKCGVTVKLVFNDRMNGEQWSELTGRFADLVHEHFSQYPNDQLTQTLNAMAADGYPTVYAVLDEGVGGWVLGTWRDFNP